MRKEQDSGFVECSWLKGEARGGRGAVRKQT